MDEIRKVHLEKLKKTLESDKFPKDDKPRVEEAIKKYYKWIENLQKVDEDDIEKTITKMVELLNEYKIYIDLELIFDSDEDFLYRQKGQLKIDNTVIEEFLPILVNKCIIKQYGNVELSINAQTPTFASVYFNSSINKNIKGGGLSLKTKDQDFSITRKLYLKSSESPNFEDEKSVIAETNIAYVVAECKTNLDKTMFQEASATAHDIKTAVSGAKYFLLCEWLDMTPLSTATTDIDEIIILRKAKRLSSNVRKNFSNSYLRKECRESYHGYLISNPYSPKMFERFIEHIFALLDDEDLIEEDILELGYF